MPIEKGKDRNRQRRIVHPDWIADSIPSMTNEPHITKAAYCIFSGGWKRKSQKSIT